MRTIIQLLAVIYSAAQSQRNPLTLDFNYMLEKQRSACKPAIIEGSWSRAKLNLLLQLSALLLRQTEYWCMYRFIDLFESPRPINMLLWLNCCKLP